MTDASLALAAGFEPATREAWLALVDKAIKGGDFEKRLVAKTIDGLRIEPLYTRANARPLDTTARPRARFGWDIRAIVIESDPAAANAAILEDLEGGVTSIAVQIAPDGGMGLAPAKETLGAALSGVMLDMCPVALVPFEAFREAAASLEAVWAERALEPEKRLGAFGADPLGTLAATGGLAAPIERSLASAAALAKSALPSPGVTALLADGVPYHNAGASEGQELAATLATLVAYLRACEAAGLAPGEALPKIAVSLAADADQFLTIAKFRAARRLLARMAEACGAEERAAEFNAATSYRMMSKRDPWNNILRSAMACAGAALGGAGAIVVLPFTMALGKPDRFARRVARNTQHVLQEESSLGRVADPAAGSWYVETLTRDLAAKAWALFQGIEARGGMAAALTSGFVQDEVAKAAEARGKDIATRRIEITGVSAFPKLGGDGVTVEPWPRGAPPLRPSRLAEPFEALRDAAETWTPSPLAGEGWGGGEPQTTDVGIPPTPDPSPPGGWGSRRDRPFVFLASLGAAADHGQRSTWTRNLLAAGGIEAFGSGGYAGPTEAVEAFKQSGATIACLASSDAMYAAHAEEAARALKAAGAKHVFMAGRPGEREPALRAAGVEGFLFHGQDMVVTLKGLHEMLGAGH